MLYIILRGHWWIIIVLHGILFGKPEGKGPLGGPRCWKKNIEVDLRETEWGDMDWIDLAQDRDQ
jgi:hypothetical protein